MERLLHNSSGVPLQLASQKEIMDTLKDKSALITGGTSGIGLETAREFLREGARRHHC